MKTHQDIYIKLFNERKERLLETGLSEDQSNRKANIFAVKQTTIEFNKLIVNSKK
jgi:hypothetical protein